MDSFEFVKKTEELLEEVNLNEKMKSLKLLREKIEEWEFEFRYTINIFTGKAS